MDPGSEHYHYKAGSIWSVAFALVFCLLVGLAANLLWREGRGTALLIAASVAVAFALLERSTTTALSETPSKDVRRRQTMLAMVLVLAVAAAMYLPTLGMHFLADDFAYVQLYSHPSPRSFLRLLTTDQSQGIWGYNAQEFRPLGGLSYMLDYWLSGTNPVGYHVTAVLLHAISSLAVFGITLRATGAGLAGAAFAALAFALLPIHSESVAWINGSRVDALPSMFYLVGFVGFVWFRSTGLARHLALASAGFLGSLMSKEIAVTFPAMLVSYDLFRWAASARESHGTGPLAKQDSVKRWRSALLPYLPIVALFAAYLAVRSAIFDNVLREGQWVFSFREAFASVAGFRAQFGRLLAEFFSLQDYNLRLFLVDFPAAAVGIVLGLLLAWALFAVRRHKSGMPTIVWVLFFGGVWYLIACLPLLITYHSPRHLYLPAAGPCIAAACLAASGWSALAGRQRLARAASAIALLSVFAVLLWKQNNNWVRAGEMSAKLAQDLPAALEATPREALVIAWAPLDYNRAYVWAWVMPFALQQPFVSGDLYSEARLMEFPDMYCCPVEQWWERKRPLLKSVLSGDPEAQVKVHRLAWDDHNGQVSRLRVSVPRKELRAMVEGVLDGPVEDTEAIAYDTAAKLMSAFMDLTARGQ